MTGERGIVGVSGAIREVVARAERAGRTSETVLVLGESGTGKELVARKIHASSSRAAGPFVAINCGALPNEIVESILFGHVKGAFTGAVMSQKGKFEAASGGTLFLDEIGETSPAVQVKLLRSLQERVIEPVGAQRPQEIDVRVVAATNRDLTAMIAAGQFRADLYFRLEVLTIRVPPLRERLEDIPVLVRHFLDQRANGRAIAVDSEALDLMASYSWPGNVRELQNFVTKAAVGAEASRITAADTARLLIDAERFARRATSPAGVTHPGGQTKPAATTLVRPEGLSGLAMAWWRFVPAREGDGQPYACELAGLERPRIEAINFVGNRARLGRDRAHAEVALETGEVSRLHATVVAAAEGFTVEDADSRNGTFVDGRAVGRGERAPVRDGSVLRIGKEWLGVAIELGTGGMKDVALAPVKLAAAFARAGGDRKARIDIRAVELVATGRALATAAELDEIAGRLVTAAKGGILDEDDARAALPDTSPRAAALSMTPEQLQQVVDSFGGNKRKAARELGISHTTLHERLKQRV
jgi:DNA-binding NtrC family response regulator